MVRRRRPRWVIHAALRFAHFDHLSQVNDTTPRGVGDGVGAPNRIELVQKRRDVELGGMDGDAEPQGDHLVRRPLGQQRQNFLFAGGSAPSRHWPTVMSREDFLRRILGKYVAYYNKSRIHRSLDKDAPLHRAIECFGVITSQPVLGGLHHQYCSI